MITTSPEQTIRAGEREVGRAWLWPIAGAVAGLMMAAAALVMRVVSGTPALPELFADSFIALLPGSLFGLVLDRLQFAAKPLLLVALASMPVPVGAALGWLYGRAWPQRRWLSRTSLASGLMYGVIIWSALGLAVAGWGDGASAALTSAGLLLAVAEVYGIALVVVARVLEVPRDQAERVDRGRRAIVVGGLAGGAVVISGGALARMLAINAEQPSSVVIPQGVADDITPNERFYVVSKNFNDPRLSADRWSLEVSGLVDQPRQFSYVEILALPTMGQSTTLECISNTLGGNLMSNAYWTGVPFAQLISAIGVQPAAQAVIFRSADNYYESFPLEQLLAPGVLLAHTMNGAQLPDKHGFPLRLILPGRYGMKNPKWITRIEFLAEPSDGYWVRRGWDREAQVQKVARIDTPADKTSIVGTQLQVGGIAFAGTRCISLVEVSDDTGTTWRQAQTTPPLGSSTWVRWTAALNDVRPGSHTVLARATDGSGAVQSPVENGSFPKGATGYHRVKIDV